MTCIKVVTKKVRISLYYQPESDICLKLSVSDLKIIGCVYCSLTSGPRGHEFCCRAPPKLYLVKMKIFAIFLVVACVKAATIPRGITLAPLQRLKHNMDSIEAMARRAASLSQVSVTNGLLGDDPSNPCADAAALLQDQKFIDCENDFSQFIGTYHPAEDDIKDYCDGTCSKTLHDVFSQILQSCNNTEVF